MGTFVKLPRTLGGRRRVAVANQHCLTAALLRNIYARKNSLWIKFKNEKGGWLDTRRDKAWSPSAITNHDSTSTSFRWCGAFPKAHPGQADWRREGWERAMGRPPKEDDLLVPFAEAGDHFGEHLDDQTMLRRFHTDLATLGLRPRRQHDARRTFFSLCLSDGARKEILTWVTHSRPKADQMDDYTTLLWAPLCDEVPKLKVSLRPKTPPIALVPKIAKSLDVDRADVTPRSESIEIGRGLAVLTSVQESARRGNRTPMAVNR